MIYCYIIQYRFCLHHDRFEYSVIINLWSITSSNKSGEVLSKKLKFMFSLKECVAPADGIQIYHTAHLN